MSTTNINTLEQNDIRNAARISAHFAAPVQPVGNPAHADDAKLMDTFIQPKITPSDIEANIVSEHYFTAADAGRFGWLTADHDDEQVRESRNGMLSSMPVRSYSGACIGIDANFIQPVGLSLLTFCVLVLKNGFTVTGESYCAIPEEFDAKRGQEFARTEAVQKIWPLLVYERRTKLVS